MPEDVITKDKPSEDPFSFLTDEDTKPNNPPSDDGGEPEEGDKKPTKGDDDSQEVKLTKKDYDALLVKVDKASKPSIDDEKMKSIMESNKIVEAMKKAILPDDGEVKASERRKQEAEFDSNPVEFMKQMIDILSERLEKSMKK